MRIRDVQKALEEMLEIARQNKEAAFSVYATAHYLIDWLEKVAVSEKIGNLTGVKEKLRDAHQGFLFCCDLLHEEEKNSDPLGYAQSGLSLLSRVTLFGSTPGLIDKNITDFDVQTSDTHCTYS